MKNSIFERASIHSYWQFLSTINWFEPWLIGVGSFHAISLLIIILTRGHSNVQVVIFLLLLAGVFFAEYLNQLAAENWQLFAEDQYFDSQGLFISTIFCLPIIVNCCVLVIIWLLESISLLKVCIKQFKRRRIAKQNEQATKKEN